MAGVDYGPVFDAAAKEWNVDPTLLKALSSQESSGNPGAISKAGAYGLTGLMPATGAGVGVTDPTDPMQQIYGGAKYLSQALDAEKTPEDALRFYHGGPDWRSKYGPESAAYAPAITARYQKLASAGQPPSQGKSPVAESATPDADAAAGAALINSMTAGAASSSGNAKTSSDPDEAAGMALIQSLGKSTPASAPTAAAANSPATWSGMGRNVAAGVLDAAGNVVNTVAAPVGNLIGNPLATGIVTAHDALAPYLGYQRFPDDVRNMLLGNQTAQPGTAAVNAIGGAIGASPDAVPANTGAERLARKVTGGALTAAAFGPAGAAAPIMGTAGTLAGDQAAQAVPDWLKPGVELAGNVAGSAAAGIGAAGVRGIAGTGGGATPGVAQLAQLARDRYGIPIQAPQMGGSVMKIVNDQSANLPWSGAAAAHAAQQTAWQRAVSREMGENAPLVTPDVMDRAATRIGGDFNAVANRTNITADPQMMNDLAGIETDARQAPLGAGGTQAIQAQIDNVVNVAAAGNGTISGQAYQQLTRAGTPLQRATQAADPNVRYYANQVREALDGAFQRSAAPQDQALLTQARGQWRAMKTIEDLVEKSPDGNLSPALLMGQVRGASSRFDGSTSGMAYTGGGNLGDLSRIGQQFLKTPPNSGTADRMLTNSLLGGGAVSATIANPWNLLSVPAGLAANRLAGAYMRGPGVANRLINSSLNGPQPIPNPLLPAAAANIEANKLAR